MVNKLRLGIAGCGWIATNVHIPNWFALKNDVQLSAVCDQNENLAKQTAKKFGINCYYTNIADALYSENLDGIDICTPPKMHATLAIDSMNAGCNVIIEKPMALSVSEADKMIAVSEKNKVKLCVVHNYRFEPMFQQIKFLVENGVIGELRGVESELVTAGMDYLQQNHWVHSLPGGVFFELAPHPIYLTLQFLDTIYSVQAIFKKHSTFPWVAADEMRVMLEAKNGLGTIAVSCGSAKSLLTFGIFGTRKRLKLDYATMTLFEYGNRRKTWISVNKSIARHSFRYLLGQSGRWHSAGHFRLFKSFVESIRNDSASPVTVQESRETVRLLEIMLKQMKTNMQGTGA